MGLSADAIEKVLAIGTPHEVQAHGLVYTDKPLHMVKEPPYTTHRIHTLGGLVGLAVRLASSHEGLMLVVVSHEQVVLRMAEYTAENHSPVLVEAEPMPTERFPMNQFVDAEAFCLMLLTRFVQDETVRDLFKLVSSLTESDVQVSEDDGMSQRTTVMAGIATRADVALQPFWTLRPYRTFAELEQPASPFLLRLKSVKGERPRCALFEADGGRWKLAAHQAIREFLVGQLGDDWLVVA